MRLLLQALMVVLAMGTLVALWATRESNRPSQAQVIIFVLMAGGLAGDPPYLDENTNFRAAMVALALGVFSLRLGPRHLPPTTKRALAGAVVLLWLWLALVDVLFADIGVDQLVAPLSSLALLTLCGLASSPAGFTPRAISRSLLAVMAPLVTATAFISDAWRPCDAFKCNGAGGFFMGPFASENNLGAQAVVVFVWVLLGLTGWLRLAGSLFMLTLLAATFSRTAMIAALVCLVVFILLALPARTHGLRSPATQPAPLGVAIAFGLAASGIGLWLVRSAAPGSFSNRGEIWRAAHDAFRERPLVGLGLHRWFELQSIGRLPEHFAHSQYLLLAFAGGYIAVLLYAVVLACGLRHCTSLPGQRWVGSLPVVALAVVGMTEVAWNPFTFDGLSWPVLAVLLLSLDEPPGWAPGPPSRATSRGRARSRAGV